MIYEIKIKCSDFSEEAIEHDVKSLECSGANGTV